MEDPCRHQKYQRALHSSKHDFYFTGSGMKWKMNTLIENKALMTRLAHCTDLPSPIGIASRLIELCQDPDVAMMDVVNTVGCDPAISSKLLRMANSPLYARKRKTENLRQAIALFGLNGTLTMALGFSLVQSTKTSSSNGLDHDRFWKRALATAVCSQVLGMYLSVEGKEELFLAGLLQDIGILVLDRVESDLYQSLENNYPPHEDIFEMEKEVLGADHAEVGAWLLKHWNLPKNLVAITAGSHQVDVVKTQRIENQLVKINMVASVLADVWWQDSIEEAIKKSAFMAKKLLAISNETLITILDESKLIINETAMLFEIDLGDQSLVNLMLEQAKEQITLRNTRAIQEAMELKNHTDQLQSKNQVLEEENKRDQMTGNYNRKYLENFLEEEYQLSTQNYYPLAVAFIDLDNFKFINDNYGHQAGDEVLVHCANILTGNIRDNDMIARYGGDEFVVVMPGTGRQGAREMSNRFAQALRDRECHITGYESISVTASIGVSVYEVGNDVSSSSDLLRDADRALYAAKKSGRDQVQVYEIDSN